jgi:hypothetical protein
VKEPTHFKSITNDDRAEYFAKYTNASLGRVKNLYLKWARLKGPMSSECQQLNRLFSQCVDGNTIKVPFHLQDPPEAQPTEDPFVLDVVHEAATQTIQATIERDRSYEGCSFDTMDLLMSRDRVAISEFELVQLAMRWCDQEGEDFRYFEPFLNFSTLSDEQQVWLLDKLPVTRDTPKLIRNGLMQSHLVNPAELSNFKLDDARLHWRPTFSSDSDRMGRFIPTLCRSLEIFHKKLIIFRPDERLTLAIYVPTKIPKASEASVSASVRVFALPRSQELQSPNYRVMPTKSNYRLYCDESVFRLYDGKQANTWVFLRRSAMDESSYRNIKEDGNRRRKQDETLQDGINYDCRASVALDKIGKSVQTHVGRVNKSGILCAVRFLLQQSLRLGCDVSHADAAPGDICH